MDVAAVFVNDAQMVLTVDTGVVHVCSALNKPIVALYSAGNMGRTKPLSNQQLVIEARGNVDNMEAEEAIAATLRQALPGWKPLQREVAH